MDLYSFSFAGMTRMDWLVLLATIRHPDNVNLIVGVTTPSILSGQRSSSLRPRRLSPKEDEHD